ncbi:MAG: hypothetical protein R3B40_15345 [Polyangiales bacterium]|nr:hypothetical protein [Sandaracinaceae bacterium]
MRVTLLTIALLTCAVSGGAHPAAAQDAPDDAELQTAVLDLRIDPALTSCPSEGVIRRTVAAHLGADPFRPEAPLRIVASLRRDGDAIEAHVVAYEADGTSAGERTVRSPTLDCAEVARALALAISVAVDPFAMTRVGAADIALAPEEAGDHELGQGVVVVEPTVDERPERSETQPRSPRWWLGCGVGVAWGAVPRTRPFLDCALKYRWPHGVLATALRQDFRGAEEGRSGGTARAWRTRAELRGCGAVAGQRILLCGTAAASLFMARGADLQNTRRGVAFVPSVGVAAGYRHGVGPHTALTVLLGVDAPLVRPALVVQYETAFTLPWLAPSFQVRLDWGAP